MTRNAILSRARLLSRVDTVGVADADGYDLVNQSLRDFANDVNGIVKEEWLQIAALFWPETTMGISIAITGGTNAQAAADVAITAADADAQTGTEMAALLETAIRTLAGISTATVVWADFAFTIDSIDGTDITIAAPADTATYEDATEMLFGGTGSSGAQTYVSDFPRDCTKRIAMPSDFRRVRHLEWDSDPLERRNLKFVQSIDQSGRPTFFSEGGSNDYLWLDRAPTERKQMWMEYKATPVALAADVAPDFEEDYHSALVWRTAELLCRTAFAEQLADARHKQYRQVVGEYIANFAGQNTRMRTDEDRRWDPVHHFRRGRIISVE